MKFGRFLFIFLYLPLLLNAQVENPVSWKSTAETANGTELRFTANIQEHWHLYSPDMEPGGPIPTTLAIEPSDAFAINGQLLASKPATKLYDSLFMMEIQYYDHSVTLTQKLDRKTDDAFVVKGSIEYMTCDDSRCLPPEIYEFELAVPARKTGVAVSKPVVALPEEEPVATTETIEEKDVPTAGTQNISVEPKPATDSAMHATRVQEANEALPENPADASVWWIFIAGFLGGLLALLTPCVFPMVPMTVSVFMKMGGKGSGLRNALLYGVSIIVLYVSLGLAVTVIFGADALNALSTHPVFNLVFFVLLVTFAAAFLGAFEMQLPTSWANFFDSKVDSSTGFLSILFMAFTLALVSFSCTGPIIGTLLVEAAVSGNTLSPLVGMFGFSLALALPFTIFAMFPSMLSTLPRSGGWLNSVKVVLGFLELAFAFKFLSTADLVAHWGILPRELFLAIWIVIFAMLGFYLLGKLQLSHDSPLESISVVRLFLAISSFVFALWMVPGMWGAPLTPISAFPPALSSQEFKLGQSHLYAANSQTHESRKYAELFHCPDGIDCYFDLDEALAASKKEDKPLLIDFTGHGCVNCRKMEAAVLSDQAVKQSLADSYIVVSLYVDDRTELPQAEQKEIEIGGVVKKIRTLGNKWSAYQTVNYQSNSQPFYVIVDSDGKKIVEPTAYDLSIPNYLEFLKQGASAYHK